MQEKLVKKVGPWVSGESFWDREHELASLRQWLDEGAHLMITAPRRTGKTSLVRELGCRLGDSYVYLYLDLQKCHTPLDVITELSIATKPYRKLWAKTKEIFRNIFASAGESVDSLEIDVLKIKLRDGLVADWQGKGERLMTALNEASEKPVVICMDEFPLVVNRLLKGQDFVITPERHKTTEEFLSWIRSVTIAYNQKLRMIITGSIGLEPILRQAKLSSTMNIFTSFELPAWDAETAIGCLDALANNYEITFLPGTKEKMIDLIGYCIPHHVQMFFSFLYDDCVYRKQKQCKPEDATRVYEKHMLSTRGHTELSTYEERLSLMLGDQLLPLALDILTEAAVSGRLTPKATQVLLQDHHFSDQDPRAALRQVFEILEHDGYLKKEGSDYVFVSKLVRDWWRARFESFYTPVSKRDNAR